MALSTRLSGISVDQEAEFFANLDRFTNKRLFETDETGNLLKDNRGNLIPKFKPLASELQQLESEKKSFPSFF